MGYTDESSYELANNFILLLAEKSVNWFAKMATIYAEIPEFHSAPF